MVAVEDDTDPTFVNSMARKHPGLGECPWHREGDERVVVVIRPVHTAVTG